MSKKPRKPSNEPSMPQKPRATTPEEMGYLGSTGDRWGELEDKFQERVEPDAPPSGAKVPRSADR